MSKSGVPVVPPAKTTSDDDNNENNNIEANLRNLGIVLSNKKEPPKPTGNYVSCVFTNNNSMLHICGHNPQRDDGTLICGKLGQDLSIDQGYEAAKWCAMNILYTLYHELNGDLTKVKRIVKVVGFVNSTPTFENHPLVINGASDLFVDVFGPTIGRHARSAVGMVSLPWGIATEVECIIELSENDLEFAA